MRQSELNEKTRECTSAFSNGKAPRCALRSIFAFCLPLPDLVALDRQTAYYAISFIRSVDRVTLQRNTHAILSRTYPRIDSGDKNCGRAARYRPTDASGPLLYGRLIVIGRARALGEVALSGWDKFLGEGRTRGEPGSSSVVSIEFVAERTSSLSY